MKKAKSKSSAPAEVRVHVYFAGRVQGVGFRYTADKLASDLCLVGWVKNLHDGRVELLCEGPKPKLDKFFDAIKASFVGKGIKKMDCSWSDATGEFDDFRIEFHY